MKSKSKLHSVLEVAFNEAIVNFKAKTGKSMKDVFGDKKAAIQRMSK